MRVTEERAGEARAAALLDGVRGAAPLVGAFRTGPEARAPIGREELAKAIDTLTRYKQGKASLETRIVEDEL